MQKAYVDLSRPFLSWSILAARIRIPTDLPETLPKHARNHLFEIIFRPGACRASRGLPEPSFSRNSFSRTIASHGKGILGGWGLIDARSKTTSGEDGALPTLCLLVNPKP